MTDGLAAWLLEQITEDERAARAAGGGIWYWSQKYGDLCNDPECPYGSLMSERPETGEDLTQLMEVHGYDVKEGWQGAEHIARWDPARVLAECDAKRQMIQSLSNWARFDMTPVEVQSASREQWYLVSLARTTLKQMALPFAGHPDYRAEWRP